VTTFPKKPPSPPRGFPGLKGMDLAKVVSTKERYEWRSSLGAENRQPPDHRSAELPYHVVAYDYGVKLNILRMLVERGCRVTVVPAQTPASDVLALKPDGVFLSNGPGDPEPCDYAIQAIKEVLKPRFRYSASASATSCWPWPPAPRP
jgi:carbamoyl-phosphate synthase small subunit